MPIRVMGQDDLGEVRRERRLARRCDTGLAARRVWSKKSDIVDAAWVTNGNAMSSVITATMTPSMSRPTRRRHHSASTAPSGSTSPRVGRPALRVGVVTDGRHAAALPLPRPPAARTGP